MMIRKTVLFTMFLTFTVSASAATVILPDSELSGWVDFGWPGGGVLNSLTDTPGDPGYRYNVTLTGADAAEMAIGQNSPGGLQADDTWEVILHNPNSYAFWIQPFMQVNSWIYRWDSTIDSWIDPGQTVSFALVFASDVTSVEAIGLKIWNDTSTGSPDPWTFEVDIVSNVFPKATDPVPDNGAGVPLSLSELSWTSPGAINPADTMVCDVYISSSDDPNFLINKTNEKLGIAGSSVLLSDLIPSLTLSSNETYFWRVDCTDPNSGNGGINPYIGEVWSFSTTNIPPVVDAGIKQNVWLSGGSVIVQLDATVSDDGLPIPPSGVQYLWTSVPSAGVSFGDPCAVDTTVTFTTADTYTLTLEADDGIYASAPFAAAVSDDVTIAVYAQGDDHLVAHWPFEGDPCDIVGGHNGTLVGDTVFDPNAQVGTSSAFFDSSDDYVEILDSGYGTDANIVTWADLTDEVTVSLWMKSNGFGTWTTIAGKGNVGYRLQQNDSTNSGYFAIGDFNGGTQRDIVGSLNIDDGQWHHLAGTFDGETVRLYVDAILEGEVDALDVIFPRDGGNFKIGDGFSGYIDQVRLNDVGLSGQKVLDQFITDGGSNSCGQKYTLGDLNQDCYTNLGDLALIAVEWLECHDIANPGCDPILP